jgi:hypothetical protein
MRSFIWERCCHLPPATYPNTSQGGKTLAYLKTKIPLGQKTGACSYMVLLEVGFTLPSPLARDAVCSYHTFSPLPTLLTKVAVSFLWHFPSGHPGWGLPSTFFPSSPDFPHLRFPQGAISQPSDPLKIGNIFPEGKINNFLNLPPPLKGQQSSEKMLLSEVLGEKEHRAMK